VSDTDHGPGARKQREPAGPTANGAQPDRSQSRFFCNTPRKVSLFFLALAVAALVIGAGFAGISKNGSPTSAETVIIRWIVLGSLVIFVAAYVVGGRMQRLSRFPRSGLGRAEPGGAGEGE
jgi:hypothetical protein